MKRAASSLISCLLLLVLTECGGGSSNTGTNTGGSNPSPPSGTELLYVGDNVGVIHEFGADPSTGKLTAFQTTSVTNQAAAADIELAADAGSMVLYATSAGLGGTNVASFVVDQKTGNLSPAGPGQTLSVPPRRPTPVGNTLFVMPDPGANAPDLFTFHINVNGVLSLLPNQPVTLPGVPQDLAVDPSGSWLFVSYEGNSGGEIASFAITNGAIGTSAGSFATGGDSPQGVRVTPDGKFVVVANGATNNVSVLALNTSTGALTAVPGSPFASATAPGAVAIDPSGKFVFVATGGNNGTILFSYALDSAGDLSPVPGTPTTLSGGAQGIHVAVDPSGKFVYTTIVGKQVAGFVIDSNTGALTAVPSSPYNIGQVSRGLTIMPHLTQ
jgi:6-phosphogluconolactonase (cycloisomerase 2 family)